MIKTKIYRKHEKNEHKENKEMKKIIGEGVKWKTGTRKQK